MGYSVALERILKVEVPERARWLRLIWAELSRVQSHLLWLGLGADALGFESLFMQCWRIREAVVDIFEKTTGGRLIHSVNKIGGVKRDIADDDLQGILARLGEIEAQFRDIVGVFLGDPSLSHRLSGLGVLSADDVRRLGAVGPMARASGVAIDVRTSGENLYDRLAFEPVVETAGDCLARCKVRAREIPRSFDLIRQAVALMPKGEHPVDVKVKGFPTGETVVRLEQPRGEVVYYVKANGGKNLERFRARTPTFANLPAMIELVKGVELADVASIILTIDPCISCTER
jgi:ech hydrogenase subunit E